jgi:hypothetical protein
MLYVKSVALEDNNLLTDSEYTVDDHSMPLQKYQSAQ